MTPEQEAAILRAKQAAAIKRTQEKMSQAPAPDRSMKDALYDNLIGDPNDGVQSYGESLGTWLNRGGETMTMGIVGDEASAAATGMLPGRTYESELARYRGNEENMSGLGQFSADLTGSIVPAFLGVGLASGAGSLAGAVGRGAAVGGGMGAVQGFAEGEGGLGNRMLGSAVGGGIGGLLGGAIPLAGAGIQRAWRAGSDAMRGGRVGSQIGAELGISPNAGRVIGDMLTPDDPAAMRAALDLAGPNAMLADASTTATGMLDATMRSPTPGARLAGERVTARAGQAGQDIVDALNGGTPIRSMDPQANIDAIRQGSAPARKMAYDAAYGNEIDWRSPAGEQLRGLIESTPDDILRRAQAERAIWPKSSPSVPDSAYANEFADTVKMADGAPSWMASELDDVNAFFAEYNKASGKMMKRPLAEVIKKNGGISPTSKAAQDLRAMGITSRTHPGLYRVGGLKDVDNLVASEMNAVFPELAADGIYSSRQGVMDALRDEAQGVALRSTDEMGDIAQRADLDRLLPEYEARRLNLDRIASGPHAPAIVGDLVPTKTVEDIDMIKRTLDAMGRQGEGMGAAMGNSNMGAGAKARAMAIRDALKEASPDYGKALETAADPIRRAQAVEFGTKVLNPKMTVNEVVNEVASSTGGELAALREGLRGQFDHVLGNIKKAASDQSIDARQARAAFSNLSSPNSEAKLSAIFKDEWPAIKQSLDRGGAAIGLRAQTAANSATNQRGVFQEAIDDAITPNALMRGKPLPAAGDAFATLMNSNPAALKRASTDVKSEIADVLTRQGAGPQAVDAIVKALTANPINTSAGKSVRKVIEALMLGQTGRTSEKLTQTLIGTGR